MTEIQKPQPDSKDQSPGMPRWLIGAMLAVAIYLIVGFVLVQFYNPLFDPRTINTMSYCDDYRNGAQLDILTNRLFRGFLIRFFLNPILLFNGGILKIPVDSFLYYLTGISIFAVGGAAFSCTRLTKTWPLYIGIVIILAWILFASYMTLVYGFFQWATCFG